MVPVPDLDARLDKIEQEFGKRLDKLERESRLRFLIQVVLAPILIAVLGYYFNYKIEQAKAGFQSVEVEAKRIEAVKGMLPELFSETPDRALIAEDVVANIVDKDVRGKIHAAVQAWVQSKIALAFAQAQSQPAKSTETLSRVETTAQTLDTPSAKVLQSYFAENKFYVVVDSELAKDQAINWAKRFTLINYKAEVYSTTNPYFVVVIGVGSFSAAKQMGDTAVAKGHAKEYFILTQKYIREKVFPS